MLNAAAKAFVAGSALVSLGLVLYAAESPGPPGWLLAAVFACWVVSPYLFLFRLPDWAKGGEAKAGYAAGVLVVAVVLGGGCAQGLLRCVFCQSGCPGGADIADYSGLAMDMRTVGGVAAEALATTTVTILMRAGPRAAPVIASQYRVAT